MSGIDFSALLANGYHAFKSEIPADWSDDWLADGKPIVWVLIPMRLPAQRKFAPGTLLLDVSYVQEVIDWDTAVKVGKVTHAVIRIGQGLRYTPDVQFARNWAEAKRLGVARSTYHLIETEVGGQRVPMDAQAAKAAGLLANDLPEGFVAMDYEPQIIKQPHATPEEIELYHRTLAERLPATERWNYTSPGLWAGYARHEKTWAADYTPPLDSIRGLPPPSLWQVGVTKIPGIKGWVDINLVVEGLALPEFPLWAYKRTPESEKRVMYYALAKEKAALIEFCDRPEGAVHTRRAVGYKMGVFRVTLDGKWACVVDGGAPDWWCRLDDVAVL